MKNPFDAMYHKICINECNECFNIVVTSEHIDFSKLELPLYGAYAIFDDENEEMFFVNEYSENCKCVVFPKVGVLAYTIIGFPFISAIKSPSSSDFKFIDKKYRYTVESDEKNLVEIINSIRLEEFEAEEFDNFQMLLYFNLQWPKENQTVKIISEKFIGNDKFESYSTFTDKTYIYIQAVDYVKDEEYNTICDNGLRIEIGKVEDGECIDKYVLFIYNKDMKIHMVTNVEPGMFLDAEFENENIESVLKIMVDEIFFLTDIPEKDDDDYHRYSYDIYDVKTDESIMNYRYTIKEERVY